MPLFAKNVFESKPFRRTKCEYTDMALKNIILPITQHGSGNTGTTNMDSALGEWFSTNMKSNVDEYDNLPIATPLYTTTHVLPEPPNLVRYNRDDTSTCTYLIWYPNSSQYGVRIRDFQHSIFL